MLILPVAAALGASTGWAAGIVLAQAPARLLGAFEFTRIQLTACAAVVSLLCLLLDLWPTTLWHHWPSFVASSLAGILLGNLAMIECLRRGGPRRTEILLAFKAPVIACLAYLWFGETMSPSDLAGGIVVLAGIFLAIQFGDNRHSSSDQLRGHLGVVVLLGLFATLCQGFGFLVVKPAMIEGMAPLTVSAVRLLGAAFFVSLVALWPAQVLRANHQLTPYLLGRTILPGVIGYIVSSSLLLYAFAHLEAGLAALLGSLSPVLVLPILWLAEGKPPRLPAVAGALIVAAGTAIIVLA